MNDKQFAIRLSLGLFSIGTLLMALYYLNLSPIIEAIGYVFTGVAFLIGTMYLIQMGFRIINKRIAISTAIICVLILMINLPIALYYFNFCLRLQNTARITFENATGNDISMISIGGCMEQQLADLKKGESQTVWINIKGECSIVLLYKIDRETKLEKPFEQLGRMKGMVTTYRIGVGPTAEHNED